MWRALLTAHDAPMHMDMLITQTYVSDHRAQLLGEARRSPPRESRRAIRDLLTRSRRPSPPVDSSPTIVPTPAG